MEIVILAAIGAIIGWLFWLHMQLVRMAAVMKTLGDGLAAYCTVAMNHDSQLKNQLQTVDSVISQLNKNTFVVEQIIKELHPESVPSKKMLH